jgi:threonine/homoserine/homoserine lactone efflux protein
MSESMIAFVVIALVIELTPGPNMGYLVMTSLAHGRKLGLAQVAGIALGLAIAGAVSALGLNRLFTLWPAFYEILRWAGLAYLLYLSFDAWRESKPSADPDNPPAALSAKRYALRGIISNLLNPKAYIFYVSVLPEFYGGSTALWQQSVVLTCLYVAIATTIHMGLVFAASHLRPMLVNRAGMTLLARGFSLSLAAIAVWLFVSTQRG